ncbi:MAG: EamA family transporter RarD [Actinomycetota bacterium]
MEHRKGIWLAVAGYVFWGVIPVYWKLLDSVPALEILAHRIVWSVPLLLVAITGRRRLAILANALRTPATGWTALAAGILLSVNWGVFVWAITTERIVEASLGYFINPLVSVALGVVVLRERLNVAQGLAIGVATVGVIGMTILAGVPPWVSLTLAFSFGTYGLLKKREAAAAPFEGLFLESLFVSAPAVAYLVFLGVDGSGALGSSASMTALLILAGAVTVFPLILFGAAAQRIPLSTLGVLQYLTPTLQLLVGIVIYNEAVTGAKWLGFAFVWIALVIYTYDNLRTMRRTPRPTS